MRTGLILMGALLLPGYAMAQDPLEAIETTLAAATDEAAKSVVQIEVERTNYGPRALTRGERMGLGIAGAYDPRYFTRPEGPSAGVVVAPGLVATSSWNVDGDGAIAVIDADGKRRHAERAGSDLNLEITLLKVVDAEGLIPFKPSKRDPEVGRTLLLVSRTASNTPLVTRGIVSGLDRLRGDAFTHSARTSFANVGGALVDLEGRLVGIAVRHTHQARQGQSSGVGFGAEIDDLIPNLEKMAQGEVIPARPKAFLGISIDPRHQGTGVRIRQIVEGTGAEAAGIKAGDVIRIFNSVEIKHFNQLVEEIQKLEIGTEIVVTVQRGEEEVDFRVQLGKRPDGR